MSPADRRTRSATPVRRLTRGLHATFGAGVLLTVRRAQRDAVLLLAWVLLVSLAGLLAIAVPRIVTGTVDEGARQAVAAAGPSADVTVLAAIGDPKADGSLVTPQDALEIADGLVGRLTPALARVAGQTVTTTAQTDAFPVRRPAASGSSSEPVAPLEARVALADAALVDSLQLVDGRLPEDTSGDASVEILISKTTAANEAIGVGDTLAEPNASADSLRFDVVGVVEVPDPVGGVDTFASIPGFREPFERPARLGVIRTTVTVLTTAGGIRRIVPTLLEPIPATIRFGLVPAAFTADLVTRVDSEIRALSANSSALTAESATALRVSSRFSDALAEFPTRVSAALAQISLLTSALLGVALTVVVLLSRLIVFRRRGELLLERARGASLASIAVRALVEAVPAAIVALALSIGAAHMLDPATPLLPTTLSWIVAGLAIVSSVVQSVALGRSVSGTGRQPANRGDRHEIAVRRRIRRFVIEGALVAIAAGALYSVRLRGLVTTGPSSVDPLLVSAPLLVAVAITIIVLRLYPLLLRALARLARRTRGALGTLGAMQAERALAAVPVFALTLAVALAVTGGLLVDSVRAGQLDASWQRVGADARITSTSGIPDAEVARLAQSDGVTAAGSFDVLASTEVSGGPAFLSTTMLTIDDGYAGIVEQVSARGPAADPRPASELRELAAASVDGDPVPVVVNSELARRMVDADFVVRFEQERVPITVVGVEDRGPTGYVGGDFLYIDRATLAERLGQDFLPTTVLLAGPGAEAAADSVTSDDTDVLTRTGWVADRQGLALVGGVVDTMVLASAAVALLALFALVATVVATARVRARSFALLRTLGVQSGVSWWLALSELAPVVVAALIGGIVAGIVSVLVIGPSLGLSVLAGGIGDPTLQISGLVVGGVAGAAVAVLGIALLVDVAVQRRNRVSEVLRVGETA